MQNDKGNDGENSKLIENEPGVIMGTTPSGEQVEIKLYDDTHGSEFSNVMYVNHGEDAFILTFCNVADRSGRVVSKVTVTAEHFRKVVQTFQENLEKYEKMMGDKNASKLPLE
ncbi:MAG: DUF3467 domain-containing protein [Candidatus Uhrbacteria bacterium]|nr:DUF3467 domain-containing protein [Candidatus Uhrbacteria bacterium]